MPKATKLPSGNWRVRVYTHTTADGKPHYKSFTGKTKKEAERKGALYTHVESKEEMSTLREAMEDYIEIKRNTLSPSTIKGYSGMVRGNVYELIENKRLANLKMTDVQKWVNTYSVNHSSKTVHNAHGFLSAVLKLYKPDMILTTRLPSREPISYHVPTNQEIHDLVRFCEQYDVELLKAVYLASYGTLRRSEICALKSSDLKGSILHVSRALVKNEKGEYIEKTTKTLSSDRYVELPEFVVEILPKSGKLVKLTPDALTKHFIQALNVIGLSKQFRFHDLRHYSASIMHALGIPDQYIMSRGGWKSDKVLKQVYRGTMDDYTQKFNHVINQAFFELQNSET